MYNSENEPHLLQFFFQQKYSSICCHLTRSLGTKHTKLRLRSEPAARTQMWGPSRHSTDVL